jgi:hypothetical protein
MEAAADGTSAASVTASNPPAATAAAAATIASGNDGYRSTTLDYRAAHTRHSLVPLPHGKQLHWLLLLLLLLPGLKLPASMGSSRTCRPGAEASAVWP